MYDCFRRASAISGSPWIEQPEVPVTPKNWARRILITAAILAAGITLATPASADGTLPGDGQVSVNGFTWSN
jgi:hypothetical protein